MIKSLLISIATPVLILAICILANESIAHYLAAWPLVLLEFTGVMGNNPEGFYDQWYGTSLVFSLLAQSILIFIFLTKTRRKA